MIVSYSGKIGSGKDLASDITRYLTSPNVGSKGSFTECEANGFVYDVVFENKKFADALKDMVCILLGCTREKLEERDFKEGELPEMWDKWKVGHDGKVPYSEMYHVQYYNTQEEAYDNWNKVTDSKPELVKMTPRLLLQLLGTECGRDILHPNIWVNALMGQYVPYSARGSSYEFEESKWVITDMRFQNEADAVKKVGGITIRINRNVGQTVIPSENWGSNSRTITTAVITEDYEDEYEIQTPEGKKLLVYPNEVIIDRGQEHSSETGLDEYEDFDYVINNNGTIEDLVEKIREILTNEKII